MSTRLFKKAGWIFVPVSVTGWFIALLTLGLLIHDFIAVDHSSHSVSDTYYNFIPYAFIYCAVYLWIASNTSEYASKSGKSNN